MKLKKVLFMAAFLITIVFPVQATIYKWIDENGVPHYSQDIPKDQAAVEIEVNEAYKPTLNSQVNSNRQMSNNSQTEGVPLKGLDCDKAVRNATKLLLEDLKKKGNGESNLFVKVMSKPDFIPGGIKRCKLESVTSKAASWLCQQKATTASQVNKCEK